MIDTSFTIVNKLGLHARAASKLVSVASKFESDIQIDKEGYIVNGKSIMGVLMLAAPKGMNLRLIIDGADEKQATEELMDLINNRFGEDQ